MKRSIAILALCIALPMLASAQDDDVYFIPSKSQAQKSVSQNGSTSTTYSASKQVSSTREVDEYNRRGRYYYYDSIDNAVDNDTLYLDGEDTPQYYYGDDNYGADDNYEYSYRLSRFYSPGLIISIGDSYWDYYYSGFYGVYDPWYYGSWYYSPWGYNSRWYYGGWYSPWYYSSWYYPWYYGGYYHAPRPHYGGVVNANPGRSYAYRSGVRTGNVSAERSRISRDPGARANSSMRVANSAVRANNAVRSSSSSRANSSVGSTSSRSYSSGSSGYSPGSNRSYGGGSMSTPSRSSSMGAGGGSVGGHSVSRGGRR